MAKAVREDWRVSTLLSVLVSRVVDAGSSTGAQGQFVAVRVHRFDNNEQPDGAVALIIAHSAAGGHVRLHSSRVHR